MTNYVTKLPVEIEVTFRLLDQSGDGLLCLDGDLRVLAMNRTANQWFSSPALQQRIHHDGLRAFLTPTGADRLRTTFDSSPVSFNDDPVSLLIQITIDNDEGPADTTLAMRTIELQVQRLPSLADADLPVPSGGYRLLCIARDITSRVAIEQALDAARQSAEEASAAKTDILYSVSHDIRTPLNGALGFLELLRKTNLSDLQVEYVSTVEKSTRGLVNIIDQLLDIARIEAGYIDLHPAPTDIASLLASSVALHRPQATAKELALTLNVDLNHITGEDEGCLNITLDSARLEQVVNNLLTNAIKFTPVGHAEVTLRGIVDDDGTLQIEIAVSDTGIGIYPEEIERLFHPYERSNRALTRRAGGVGLGLAITRHLVHAMGAEINVTSEPHVGSTFVVSNRFHPAQYSIGASEAHQATTVAPSPEIRFSPAAASTTLSDTVSSPHDITVLAVDDSDINLSYIVSLLGHYEFRVESALSGHEALRQVTQINPDIVFLDIHMPIMNGYETFAEIRQLYTFQRPTVIAITADASRETRNEIASAGFDDILFKPASASDFLNTIYRHTGSPATNDRQNTPTLAPDAVLDKAFGMHMSDDDEDLWHTNLTQFAIELNEMIPKLQNARIDTNPKAIADLSHRIAGTASYVGGGELNASARNVQELANAAVPGDLNQEVDTLISVARRFLGVCHNTNASS